MITRNRTRVKKLFFFVCLFVCFIYYLLLRVLREKASSFLLDDFYRTPGGIQFEGPGAGTKPITVTIEEQDYLGDIEILQDYLDKVHCTHTHT
jgi:hypothetical protein